MISHRKAPPPSGDPYTDREMPWSVNLTGKVERWLLGLDPETAEQVAASIDLPEQEAANGQAGLMAKNRRDVRRSRTDLDESNIAAHRARMLSEVRALR